MNLTGIIDLKERIATSDAFKPDERDFILECINTAVTDQVVGAMAAKHSARNYLGRIESLWAAFSIDDGGEGLCAAPLGDFTLPLVGADIRMVKGRIVPLARRMASMFGRPVRLAKFTKRTDVEIYQP